MRKASQRFQPLKGLNLSVAKIFMDPGEAQISENMDYRRAPGLRIRPGYARLLDVDGTTVMKVSGAKVSRIMAFERDDDAVKIVVAHGGSVSAFDAGSTEWTS